MRQILDQNQLQSITLTDFLSLVSIGDNSSIFAKWTTEPEEIDFKTNNNAKNEK